MGRPKTVIGALKKLKYPSYGSLVLFLRHRNILFRKRYGIFGLIITPRHLLLNVFAPIIFVILSANFIFELIENNFLLSFALLSSLFLLTTFLLSKIAPRFVATKTLYLIFVYIPGYFAQFIYYITFLLSPRQRHGTWSGLG